MKNDYTPGSLISVRDRTWIVQPSDDENLLKIKPLGGSEEEATAIYLPLKFADDDIKDAKFALPTREDLGDISTANQLYNAARLSFRNGAGPFRCLAKLSFRPRSYQMVPLIMALKMGDNPVRMLIADDVGVGKTIESLLVVKELLDRNKINRFAVICLPHLCEQWKQEIKDKFDIDAVIIRSNTQARLDREIQGDTSVYDYYPFQVISIDYIKSDTRRNVFIKSCPEMLIVDEAHTCAKPAGATKSQQQRYKLLREIADNANQHLLLLTATPHSGKSEEFQSLLGLLKDKFEDIDIAESTQNQRKELSAHFIQRKRANVEHWMNEDTCFPKRDAGEFDYSLSEEYQQFFDDILIFVKEIISGDGTKRVHYWTALALMRGVMSSPSAGIEMLRNRIEKLGEKDKESNDFNALLDSEFIELDSTPIEFLDSKQWTKSQKQLKGFADRLDNLKGIKNDLKSEAAYMIIEDWINNKDNPVIFCRYIATAKYLGEVIKPFLEKKFKGITVQVITSEDPDEVRKERIDEMGNSKKRVLICTDCLSEGINLQEYFTAVLHYDLPWNPNRLEQREGRVDRYGQTAKEVKAYLLYGSDNPIDGVVFNVLLKKVREIKKSLQISMPFPDDSQTILDTVMKSILLNPQTKSDVIQPSFDFMNDERKEIEDRLSNSIAEAANREERSRSIFAQNAIKADEVEEDLKEVDNILGDPKAVEEFVVTTLRGILGVQIEERTHGQTRMDTDGHGRYILFTQNLPEILKFTLPQKKEIKISFESPTPEGHLYLGRNHLFTEQLCQFILANSMDKAEKRAARAAVIKSDFVKTKTTIALFRCRNVIAPKNGFGRQIVAEEMLLWGYSGMPSEEVFLSQEEAKDILDNAKATANIDEASRWFDFLKPELEYIKDFKGKFDEVAEVRSEKLVEAHGRFAKTVGGEKYKIVIPVLPMDIMGIYIIIPE